MKKAFQKLLALFLSISLILTTIPITSFATETVSNFTENVISDNAFEVIEKREFDKKVYCLSDGSYVAAVYPEAVHYLNKDGKFEEYNNSLIEYEIQGETLFKNKSSDKDIFLSKKAKQNKMVRINANGYEIYWGFEKINNC